MMSDTDTSWLHDQTFGGKAKDFWWRVDQKAMSRSSASSRRAAIGLRLPGIGALSIHEGAENEVFSAERKTGDPISPEVARIAGGPDRLKTVGEGDGTRTRNHQIDSLVL